MRFQFLILGGLLTASAILWKTGSHLATKLQRDDELLDLTVRVEPGMIAKGNFTTYVSGRHLMGLQYPAATLSASSELRRSDLIARYSISCAEKQVRSGQIPPIGRVISDGTSIMIVLLPFEANAGDR